MLQHNHTNRPSVSKTLPVTSRFPHVFSCTSSFLSFYLCLRPFFSWRLLRSSCLRFMNKLKKRKEEEGKMEADKTDERSPELLFCVLFQPSPPLWAFWKTSPLLFLLFKCEVDLIAESHSCLRMSDSGTFCRQVRRVIKRVGETKAFMWSGLNFISPTIHSASELLIHANSPFPTVIVWDRPVRHHLVSSTQNAASHLHRYLLPFEICLTYSAFSLFMQLFCMSPHLPITTQSSFSSFVVSDQQPPPPPPVSGLYRGDLCWCCCQSQNLPKESKQPKPTRNNLHISSSVINIILISFSCLSWWKSFTEKHFQPTFTRGKTEHISREKGTSHLSRTGSHVQSTPTQKTTTQDSKEWWVSKHTQV